MILTSPSILAQRRLGGLACVDVLVCIRFQLLTPFAALSERFQSVTFSFQLYNWKHAENIASACQFGIELKGIYCWVWKKHCGLCPEAKNNQMRRAPFDRSSCPINPYNYFEYNRLDISQKEQPEIRFPRWKSGHERRTSLVKHSVDTLQGKGKPQLLSATMPECRKCYGWEADRRCPWRSQQNF